MGRFKEFMVNAVTGFCLLLVFEVVLLFIPVCIALITHWVNPTLNFEHYLGWFNGAAFGFISLLFFFGFFGDEFKAVFFGKE